MTTADKKAEVKPFMDPNDPDNTKLDTYFAITKFKLPGDSGFIFLYLNHKNPITGKGDSTTWTLPPFLAPFGISPPYKGDGGPAMALEIGACPPFTREDVATAVQARLEAVQYWMCCKISAQSYLDAEQNLPPKDRFWEEPISIEALMAKVNAPFKRGQKNREFNPLIKPAQWIDEIVGTKKDPSKIIPAHLGKPTIKCSITTKAARRQPPKPMPIIMQRVGKQFVPMQGLEASNIIGCIGERHNVQANIRIHASADTSDRSSATIKASLISATDLGGYEKQAPVTASDTIDATMAYLPAGYLDQQPQDNNNNTVDSDPMQGVSSTTTTYEDEDTDKAAHAAMAQQIHDKAMAGQDGF